MYSRFFSTIAKNTVLEVAKKQGAKPIVNEGFKKNLEWMTKQIEKMNSKPNSFTKLDAKEFESAMKEAEELEARSVYYR